MEKKIYDIVIFGNYTKDTIVSKTGTRYVDGGGFNYGAHAAANSGKSVAAVTRLAEEDKHVVEILESFGLTINYSWGNQQGVEHLAEAVYEGTQEQFLRGWFPQR